jgi:hypothetical protein
MALKPFPSDKKVLTQPVKPILLGLLMYTLKPVPFKERKTYLRS